MLAGRSARRLVAVVVAAGAVPLLLLGPAGPVPGQAVAAPVAAGDPPYRLGYASGDMPQAAAVDGLTGRPVGSPLPAGRVEEPSVRGDAAVFVTHLDGHADTELMYQAPGARAAVQLTHDGFTDRHPALSPDGRWVAFESDRDGQPDIWAVRTDGSGLRRVTDHPGDDRWPSWSPGGDRIAFSSTRDDPAGDLYTVAATGGAATRVTDGAAADTEPAWSPAGDRIAFTTTRWRADGDLATVAPGGGTVTRLVGGEQAAWSPSGDRIAFVTRDADRTGDVAVLTLAGGAVRPVAVQARTVETSPTWRGTVVCYVQLRFAPTVGEGGLTADVWSADASGQDRRDLTNTVAHTESAPAFTADGGRLAYAEHDPENGSSRIVIADAEGRNGRPLTAFTPGTRDDDPTWSPDGTMIAFSRTVRRDGPVSSVVFVVRVSDGAELGTVAIPAYLSGQDTQPAWSPDGKRLAIVRSATVTPQVPITPGPVDRLAYPGSQFDVDQTIATPEIPPNPDIVFMVDTTGSMTDTIGAIRARIHTIVAEVTQSQPTAQFALIGYRGGADNTDGYQTGYRLAMRLQPIDADVANNPLDSALADFPTGGGSGQEDWLYPMHRVATGDIAFRPDSSRVIVLIGDAWSAQDRYVVFNPPPPRFAAALPAVGPELVAQKIRVVAVPVETNQGEGGLDGPDGAGRHPASDITRITGGVLLPTTPASQGGDATAVIAAILSGLRALSITVTPTVTSCDRALSVAFDPAGSTTVAGGVVVHYRQRVTVAAGAAPGTVLRCDVAYQLTPTGGRLAVPIVVRVAEPAVPLVVVDDVSVQAAGAQGAIVQYTSTAVDARGGALTPVCVPGPGGTFPIGQTLVTCTATDADGRVGRDTALISVIEPAGGRAPRIWLVTLAFPTPGTVQVTGQVDRTGHLAGPCPATPDDEGPAFAPDGQRLVFSRAGVLCVLDGAGATSLPVVPPAARPGTAADPAWSPDGARIAYSWSEPRGESDDTGIWTVPATGGAPAPVIESAGQAIQPAYRPLPAVGLSITVAAAPQPGYVGGAPIQVTVTASNTAAVPSTRVWLSVQLPAGAGPAPAPVFVGTLPVGGSTTLPVTLVPREALTGVIRAQVSGVYPGERTATAQAESSLTVTQPKLVLDPAIGPPGFVTGAVGTGFPPGVTVTLLWDPGISAPTTVQVGPDGTFRRQMLVFYHDRIGPRRLVATGSGFGAVDAQFVVVPGGQEPKDFVQRR